MLKMDASPRGIIHPSIPHSDTAGWARIQKVVPWYYKSICADGPGVKNGPGAVDGKQESIASIYPILVSTSDTSDDTAYGMTRAMVDNIADYQEGAPGAYGWALDKQIEDFYLPSDPGAIRYFKEKGAWSAKAQANHEAMLKRQAVLSKAWLAHVAKPGDDFDKGWMAARVAALTAAGMDPVFATW